MKKRVFLFVFDGFGVGASEDSKDFGDEGSNTFQHVYDKCNPQIPNLTKLGLKNIDGLNMPKKTHPIGSFGKLREKSIGKDTTTGHFEMMGIISQAPMPTFPSGFPNEVVEKLQTAFGTKILGNKVASGTQIIAELGEDHLKTGYPIVYTSADSVLQIATHVDVVPLEKLYELCQKAREIMSGKWAVGRVIARPFKGTLGNFERINEGRKDFSLVPDKNNSMQRLFDAGVKVYTVGKISEIFANQAISQSFVNHNNQDSWKVALELEQQNIDGFVFVNLVDTDMLFGHRNDVAGYAHSLEQSDKFLGQFLKNMKDGDVVIITGDHGNDPSTKSTDHSREYAPLVIFGKSVAAGINLGTLNGFSNIGEFVEDYLLGTKKSEIGEKVWKK